MSIASEYHNATKYHPETINDGPGVDWNSQPSPYKTFRAKTRIDLSSHLLLARDADSDRPILTDPDILSPFADLSRLSTLLLHTNGVTAQQPLQHGSVFFRAAPSAGALYPTEIYVAVRDVHGIEDGIYNYQVQEHSLVPVLEGNYWPDLLAQTDDAEALKSARCVVIMSIIFGRSSWRYHSRAYRRILLDSGHVLGNLMVMGPELGFEPRPITAFNDGAVDDMMFFDREQESVLVLTALADEKLEPAPLGVSREQFPSVDMDPILRVHQSGAILENPTKKAAPLPPAETPTSEAQLTLALSRRTIPWERELGPTILLRRSTRRFSGNAISLEQLGMILNYGNQGTGDEALSHFLNPAALGTFLSVHQVDGLDAGLYRFDPWSSRLLLLRRGYFARDDHVIGLGQDLVRDAAVVIYHFANIEETCALLGDRGYRYLNLDAGHIGQRINLAALRLGVGVSGIGGYFDDQANDLFHRPLSEGVVYMTCLGTLPD